MFYITHTADIQIKNRKEYLLKPTLKMLRTLEDYVKQIKSKVHVISGDLFEFPNPTLSEQKMIYEHIINLLMIDSLEELIIISGNHDLVKAKNQTVEESKSNAISIFTDIINNVPFAANKLRYFSANGIYESKVSNDIEYVVYALNDDSKRSEWPDLKNKINPNKIQICLYHAMIQEYAVKDNVPIPEHVLQKLDTLDLFPANSYILAGDIHKTLIFGGQENQTFIYPGSPMQHTYGEGYYITVDENSAKPNVTSLNPELKPRSIFCYTISDNKTVEMNMVEWNHSSIEYYTIELDSKLEPDLALSIMQNKLNDIKTDAITVCVKVKSNSNLVAIEKDLFNLLMGKFKCDEVLINFTYEKLKTSNTVSSSYVSEILVDKFENNENNLSVESVLNTETIDELILSEAEIVKLFNAIVSSKFTTINEQTRDKIEKLFIENLRKTYASVNNRYNIVFKEIRTNNFMILTDTQVQLDNEGINRILGTNGIGKTTLYKMIRWVITGMISENMSANQAVKNNLICFNKNLPDENFVKVELDMVINDNPIRIVRTLERVWKQNVTEEEKRQSNTDNFISGLKRDFQLIMNYDSENEEERKCYTGTSAENVLNNWFGTTVNNLLFINSIKIDSIINSSSDSLKNIILKYLSIDYLNELENLLPEVKESLFELYPKPKRDADSINEEIWDADVKLKQNEEEEQKSQEALKILDSDVEKTQESLTNLNNNLAQLEYIEKDILQNKSELSTLENEQASLKMHDIPELRNVDLIENRITESTRLISDLVNQENKFKSDFDSLTTKQSDVHMSIVNLLREAQGKIQDGIRTIEEAKAKFETELESKKNEYETIKETHKSKLLELRSKLEEAKNEASSNLISKKSEYESLTKQIDELAQTIRSGFCSTCKRKFDDFDEHKVTDLTDKIRELKAQQASIDFTELETANSKAIKDVIDCENEIKLTEHNATNFEPLVQKNSEILEIQEKINKLAAESNRLENSLLKLNIEYISTHSISNLEDILNLKTLFVNVYYRLGDFEKITTEINVVKNQLDNVKHELNLLRNELDALKNEKFKAVEFNHKIEMLILENEKTEAQKQKLTSEIEKIKKIISDKEQTISEIPNIKNQIEENSQKISEIKKSKETLMVYIDALQTSKLKTILNKGLLEKELENLIGYNEANTIWKIYNTIIGKNELKRIIFEYYINFLNNTLNFLLKDVPFKLIWSPENDLQIIHITDGKFVYQSVKQASGMEATFLGLTFIYALHMLNIKNSVNALFIDEISGTLNSGNNLSYEAENYQEIFVKILSKFRNKSVFIVDHTISSFNENCTYEVIPNENHSASKFIKH